MSDKKFDGMLPPGSPKKSGGFPLSRTVMTRTTELGSYFYKGSKDSKGSNTFINNVNNNIKNQNRNKNTTNKKEEKGDKEDKEEPSFNGSFIITGAVSCASLKQEDTWAYDCVQSLDFFNALNNNDKDNDKDTTTKDNPNPTTTEDTTTKETTSPQNIKSSKSSKHSLTSIKLIAGVFDGHDGPQMSDYCREHMIPHIIEELKKKEKDESSENSKSSIINHSLVAAFEASEARFSKNQAPPTLGQEPAPLPKMSFLKKFATCNFLAQPRRGGTTANCLLLNVEGPPSSAITAYVANCGDSRCITDGGSGSSRSGCPLKFQDVTADHRPTSGAEAARLKSAQARGEVRVLKDHMKTTRLYPGGLAVSRTIGDVALTRAAIATPEVYECDVKLTDDKPRVRFVMGTDGIFDCLETDQITEVVAEEERERGERLNAKELAKVILVKCLEACGLRDDMTVLVVELAQEVVEGDGATALGDVTVKTNV